jgi:hypothetical protein
MKTRLKFIAIGIGAGFAVIILGLTTLAAYHFSQYRANGANLMENAASQVSILDPIMGSQSQLGVPIWIHASAIGPHPFLSMELWINGQLIKVQGTSANERTPLDRQFTWIPTAAGTYSLVVRAMNTEKQSIYSTSIAVIVSTDEVSEGVSAGGGTDDGTEGVNTAGAQDSSSSSNAGGNAYLPPQPPEPDDSVAPGESWNGSPGNWIVSMTSASPPGAPELIADTGICTASLSIHDLSENEEGFTVYRQVTGSPAWKKVTTLASSDSEWLTYTDENVYGGLLYYVAAFNSQGESSSNLVLVNVDAENCTNPIADAPQITLEIVNVIPTAGTVNNYCYRSFDGISWMRWPQDSFLNSHNEPILLTDAGNEAASQTLDLMLECWGWSGDELVYLGDAVFNGLGPLQPGWQQLGMDRLSAEILIGSRPDVEIPVFYPMNDDDFSGLITSIGDPTHFIDIDLPPTIDLNLPLIKADITKNPDVCMSHLPPHAQNQLGKLLFCWPYDGFDSGSDGANPQPYLVWTILDQCASSYISDGSQAVDCMSYDELVYHANSSYGEVGFEIANFNSSGFHTYTVNADHLTSFAIPPLACEGNRTFKVRLYYKSAGVDPIYTASEWSNAVSIPCFEPLTTTFIDVTFQTLTFISVADGDIGEADDIEVYGSFGLSTSAGDRWLVLGGYADLADCPDEDNLSASGCFKTFENGLYKFSDIALCNVWNTSQYYEALKGNQCTWGGWQLANNTVRIPIYDNDALDIHISLVDYDEEPMNAYDDICSGDLITDTFSAVQWGAMKGQEWTFTSQHEDAYCTITIEVNGVPDGEG